MKTTVEAMAEAIQRELAGYSQEVADGVKTEVRATAKECRDELREKSPKMTGDYKKGWRDVVVYESADDIRISVRNPKEYRLAHLLEHGHTIKNGTGRVYGEVKEQQHIGFAADQAYDMLWKREKVVVKG